MSYQLETTEQIYGEQPYLTHVIKGETPEEDLHLFGMRVPSYGIINFGSITNNSFKTIVLAEKGITSPIQLKSIYAFTSTGGNDETRFSLFRGTTRIVEMRIPSGEMPYQFPEGAIIDPSLSITVRPRYNISQLLIYWQPVHVLSNVQV